MDILPPISNIKRNHPVSLPDATLFPKSIGVLAAGILSASVYTCEIDRTPRFIFLGIGIVLIIIAVILLIRYIKQVTAFKKYKPSWEKHKSIYDDFAIELNHWYDSGLPPKSCDGDLLRPPPAEGTSESQRYPNDPLHNACQRHQWHLLSYKKHGLVFR